MLKCFNSSFSTTETFVTFPGTSNAVASGYEIAVPCIELCSSSACTVKLRKYNSGSSSANYEGTLSLAANTPYVLTEKQFFESGQKLSFIASAGTVYVSVSYDNSTTLN